MVVLMLPKVKQQETVNLLHTFNLAATIRATVCHVKIRWSDPEQGWQGVCVVI